MEAGLFSKCSSTIPMMVLMITQRSNCPSQQEEYIYVYGDMDDDGFYEGEFIS